MRKFPVLFVLLAFVTAAVRVQLVSEPRRAAESRALEQGEQR